MLGLPVVEDADQHGVAGNIQADGTAWFGGATARGQRVVRVSVCN